MRPNNNNKRTRRPSCFGVFGFLLLLSASFATAEAAIMGTRYYPVAQISSNKAIRANWLLRLVPGLRKQARTTRAAPILPESTTTGKDEELHYTDSDSQSEDGNDFLSTDYSSQDTSSPNPFAYIGASLPSFLQTLDDWGDGRHQDCRLD